ncbi:putative integral membrane protein [Acanthocheilonema viteae]
MQYTSPIYLKRSPYRLYRPYQFDVPQTTIPSNSTILYRTPNLDILSEVNRRSRRLERIVSYQKILTITQMLFSLLLIILELTKILLVWEHFNYWEQRFVLICEIFQPTLFATAAFITLYCVLRPTKSTSQIAIASLIATLIPLFMFPTQSPFVLNAIEAVRVSRSIERSSTVTDGLRSEISSLSNGLGNFEQLQRLAQLPFLTLSKNVGTEDWKSTSTFSSPAPSVSSSSSFYAIQQLLSLQYLLIAYAFFSFAYSILLVLMLISYVQLIQLQ